MPELINDFQSLPDEYQQVIRQAQEDYQITVAPLQLLVGGWSGAVVYLVSVSANGSGQVEHCILKLDRKGKSSRADEVTRHTNMLTKASSTFVRDHIAELVFERVEVEGATWLASPTVRVRAQPFGGGVRILHPNTLKSLIGQINFDSERSQSEQDFRILIPASDWEVVTLFCLQHLGNPHDAGLKPDPYLESGPDRELAEEFADVLNMRLKPDQYTYQSNGFVIENDPAPTANVYARGQPTVRIYRIFEVRIIDERLCAGMLRASQQYSDQDLERLALDDFQSGGKGRANAILTLPLSLVRDPYLALPPEMRYRAITVAGHQLDESALAVLEGVDVPQYQRL